MQTKYHWFVSSALHWTTDSNLIKALTRQRTADRYKRGLKATQYCVYRVPLPQDAEYKIDGYKPLVDGAEWICTEYYAEK